MSPTSFQVMSFFVCADNVVRYIVCSFVTSVVCQKYKAINFLTQLLLYRLRVGA